jgi:SOS response associated peptidase (SRAP)
VGKRQGEETLCRSRARVRDIPSLRFSAVKTTTYICRLRVTHRYYEWLKKGSQRIPHFTRHKDQRLMLFAGLYDSVTLEGEYHAFMTGKYIRIADAEW